MIRTINVVDVGSSEVLGIASFLDDEAGRAEAEPSFIANG